MIKKRLIELIDKYLSGTGTDSERQLVEEYLKRLEGDSYPTLDIEQEQKLKEAMWKQIKHQTAQEVRMVWYKRKAVRLIAVAASVILVIQIGILLFSNNSYKEKSVTFQKDQQVKNDKIFTVHREVNTTGKEERIQLADGSLIVLVNKSEILYRQPFVDRRDVTLTGKAFFKVAKDQTKPFTVSTGSITVTALGTEFTVTAFKNTDRVTVRLYEGKVVVKALDKDDKKLKNNVYLLPGQEFIYSAQTISKVSVFKLNRNTPPEQIMDEELSGDNPAIPDTKVSYFMFNNQSLAQVLDDLAALYDMKIIYDKKDLENIYFTAKYSRSESLEPILKRIATLNNLTIAKKDNAFVIRR